MKNTLLVCLFIITIPPSFSQVNLDSGLVAYYPFNGNANDESGNGNNAAFNNATLTSDRSGNPNSAYYFNGIDNYIQVPNSSSLVPQELSLFAVVKPMGFYFGSCYNTCIIDKGSPDYIAGDYSLRFTSSAYTGGNCDNPDTLHQNFVGYSYLNKSASLYTPNVTYNTSYCIVYTVSADSLKLYVDGILKWKDAKIYGIGINSQDLFLGRKNNSQFPYWFKGVMDDIRIYNRAVNQLEISTLCASVLPVTLTGFEANIVNKQIKLNWNIESESGIRSFTVQRSLTAQSDFVPLGIVEAKNTHSYFFVDNTADINKDYFYRLAILGNNKAIHYSDIKTAKINFLKKFTILYPNPAKGAIVVRMEGYRGKAEFKIINSVGQVVSRENRLIIDNSPLQLKLIKQSKGVYWLKIETGNGGSTEKIMIY